jgi:hypothetical protein
MPKPKTMGRAGIWEDQVGVPVLRDRIGMDGGGFPTDKHIPWGTAKYLSLRFH